jgi:hypothetical protein
MRNIADLTDGKPIAVLLQSMSGVSAINPLVAFCDIHGGKREVLFFILSRTPHETIWSSMALRSVRLGVRSRKLSINGQSLDGWPEMYYLELVRASEGTLSCWSRLYLQSLATHQTALGPRGRLWAFSLWVIHKEGLCPSSGDINRLMMMEV